MKKSVLILGRTGAGKTVLLDKLLSDCDADKVTKLSIDKLAEVGTKNFVKQFDVIGVEELYSDEHLKFIVGLMSLYDVNFIVTSQCRQGTFDANILSNFYVIPVAYESR